MNRDFRLTSLLAKTPVSLLVPVAGLTLARILFELVIPLPNLVSVFLGPPLEEALKGLFMLVLAVMLCRMFPKVAPLHPLLIFSVAILIPSTFISMVESLTKGDQAGYAMIRLSIHSGWVAIGLVMMLHLRRKPSGTPIWLWLGVAGASVPHMFWNASIAFDWGSIIQTCQVVFPWLFVWIAFLLVPRPRSPRLTFLMQPAIWRGE